MTAVLAPAKLPSALPTGPEHRLESLVRWMAGQGLQADGGALRLTRIDGGQSNPSWRLDTPGRAWVLRAKPAPVAELLPSAHAIEREFRVLRALQASAVPVPRALALCEDESVIGVAFYLMDFVEGRTFRDSSLAGVAPADRRACFDEAARVLAELHRVDWRAQGLQDFGRHEGYFSRMIRRWSQQYEATRSEPVPAMEQLMAWLPAHIPAGADGAEATCITHGDYRMENLMFHPQRSEVVAVLDWELATLGHPLGDLAYNAMAWHMPAGLLRGMGDLDLAALGLPTEAEYLARYCAHAGLDAGALARDWPFYLAFNLFRLSAILQGVGHRERAGMASSSSAARIAALAPHVADWGWAIAEGRRPVFQAGSAG